jgi:hypothetical protein
MLYGNFSKSQVSQYYFSLHSSVQSLQFSTSAIFSYSYIIQKTEHCYSFHFFSSIVSHLDIFLALLSTLSRSIPGVNVMIGTILGQCRCININEYICTYVYMHCLLFVKIINPDLLFLNR